MYETPENRLIFSGRLSAFSSWTEDIHDDHDPTNAGSRARLILEHNFGYGWSGLARTEWGFDPFFEGGEDNHFKRQQYVGLTNNRYGTLLVGKQYSIWYSMVGVWTDYYWINGTAAQGSFGGHTSDGAFEGNGRPDRAVTY